MKRTVYLFPFLAAVLTFGCGGSTTTPPGPSPATGLSYEDPAAVPGEWKLVKDATSTSKHLVLNLLGPSDGTKYRGVGFTLQADPTMVKIAQFKDGNGNPTGYYKSGGIFVDKNNAGTSDVPPSLQAGGLSNSKLMVGIFQKTDNELYTPAHGFPYTGATAKDCRGIVLQVAIDFDTELKAMPGRVPLGVLKARTIPEHVGTLATRKTEVASLKVGTLTLQ